MPSPNISKDEIIDRLRTVFRNCGYEGATLTKISKATGLGKASLYHHFPGGKESMAMAVLASGGQWFQSAILEVLAKPTTPLERLTEMTDNLSSYYEDGKQLCMLGVLTLTDEEDAIFKQPVQQALQTWINTIAKLLKETGISEPEAQQRAENAVISIQGALIVSRGLSNTDSFKRLMQNLPQELLKN